MHSGTGNSTPDRSSTRAVPRNQVGGVHDSASPVVGVVEHRPNQVAQHDTEAWVRSLRPEPDAESTSVFDAPAAPLPPTPPPGMPRERAVPREGAEESHVPSAETALVRRPQPDPAPPTEDTENQRSGQSTVVVSPSAAAHETAAMLAQERMRSRLRRSRICAGVVEWVGSLVAVILVVHAVLTVSGANPENFVASFTSSVAPVLATGFMNLFQPDDPALALVLNCGSAAVFWVLAASMIGRLIRKVWI